jgi:hypothetical protein
VLVANAAQAAASTRLQIFTIVKDARVALDVQVVVSLVCQQEQLLAQVQEVVQHAAEQQVAELYVTIL